MKNIITILLLFSFIGLNAQINFTIQGDLGSGTINVNTDSVLTIDNYSELSNLSDYSHDIVVVKDFTYTVGAGTYITKGGIFQKLGNTNDGVITINGWTRDWDNIHFKSEWITGVDDNDRLQQSINFLSNKGGGVLELEQREYIVTRKGVISSSRDYSIEMKSNVTIEGNQAILKIDDGLIAAADNGIDIINIEGVNNIKIRNLTFDGNTAGQTNTAYDQEGKSSGIHFYGDVGVTCDNMTFTNLRFLHFFGNPVNAKSGTVQDWTPLFTNAFFENIYTKEYGEGFQLLNFKNLTIKDLYADPTNVCLGDHFELVRTDSFFIDNYTNIGGSGAGSGIDCFGARNGTIKSFNISNVSNGVEIHEDQFGNDSENLRFIDGKISTQLVGVGGANGFALTNENTGTQNIDITNVTVEKFHVGFALNDADTISATVRLTNCRAVDNTSHGITISSVNETHILGGEFSRNNGNGIFVTNINSPAALDTMLVNVNGAIANDNTGSGLLIEQTGTTKKLKGNFSLYAANNNANAVGATKQRQIVFNRGNIKPDIEINNLSNSERINENVSTSQPITGFDKLVYNGGGNLQLLTGGFDNQEIEITTTNPSGFTLKDSDVATGIHTFDRKDLAIDSAESIVLQYDFEANIWKELYRTNQKSFLTNINSRPHAYTANPLVDEVILIDASAGLNMQLLNGSPKVGEKYTYKITDNTNTVIINGNGKNFDGGVSTIVFSGGTGLNKYRTISYDGVEWKIIGEN